MIKTEKIKFSIAIVILCLCNVTIYSQFLISSTPKVIEQRDFPSRVSEWTSSDVVYDKVILSILAPDKTVYKTYEKEGRLPVTLFIAFYNSLEKSDLSHSPIVCFTGQGWDITSTSKKEISVFKDTMETIKVNQLVQQKSGSNLMTFYWYQTYEDSFTNRGVQKLTLFVKKLFGRPERNAFVRVTMNMPPGAQTKEMSEDLSEFVIKLYPELKNYFI